MFVIQLKHNQAQQLATRNRKQINFIAESSSRKYFA